ncbi:hypothetical protein [Limnofasciculus baicalensis]|uniref:Uncharacterized protein n=1 Tax=Limnofasciculus baicalensis BBK-W-15 TaxID=2699891 RepID=A0AAE3KQG3_9CYAN|nr:hypothetical protein [Limnofasciculus baicalensis]MCP2727322.1 hypothetical protein [Limnofasciculus baicalensis BBK-W-15]
MHKGFNPNPKTENATERISKQLIRLVKEFEKNQRQTIPIFQTTPKHLFALSSAVHQAAQQFSDLHFEVEYLEGPLVKISEHKSNRKGFSYTWVETSNTTGKWLLMAAPPGAWDYRCLSVWRDRDKAIEVSDSIYQEVKTMPLGDWYKRIGTYQLLIESIPDDDDTVVSVMYPGTGEVIPVEEDAQERIELLLKQVVNDPGDKDDILSQIKEFLP